MSNDDYLDPFVRAIANTAKNLTKRELFAAMAMQGLRAADANATSYTESSTLAKLAVQDADALLKELAK